MTPDRTRSERAIAFLVAQIRPDWQEPGVLAALRKVSDRPLDRTVAAALHCAAHRHDQRTPEAIARDGEHWQALDRMAGRPASAAPDPRCPDHGDYLPCLHCQRDAAGEPASADRVRDILDAAGIRRAGGRPAPLTEPHQGPITSEPHHRPTEADTEAERARQLAAHVAITEGA